MKKSHLFALVVLSTALVACEKPQDATPKNFLTALKTTGRGQKKDICIAQDAFMRLSDYAFDGPIYAVAGEPRPHAKQLDVLVNVGIIRVSGTRQAEERTPKFSATGNKVEFDKYELTDLGREFSKTFGLSDHDVCYAEAVPAAVVKWEGPMQRGGHEVVDVTFKRKVIQIADWAKSDKFKQAFDVKTAIDKAEAEETTATLKRTSVGWEALVD